MITNKKNLIIGIGFLILALLCLAGIVAQGTESYYITGLILFTIIGIGFLKRTKMY